MVHVGEGKVVITGSARKAARSNCRSCKSCRCQRVGQFVARYRRDHAVGYIKAPHINRVAVQRAAGNHVGRKRSADVCISDVQRGCRDCAGNACPCGGQITRGIDLEPTVSDVDAAAGDLRRGKIHRSRGDVCPLVAASPERNLFRCEYRSQRNQ